MKAKPAVEFRVVKLSSPLLETIRRRRDAEGASTLEFVTGAVSRNLPTAIEKLREIGVSAGKGTKQIVRLPFSPQAGTLAALKTASGETGLSATQLLSICLVSAVDGTTEVARKKRATKPAPSTRKRPRG